jgi:hypothetical protein
MEHRINQTTRKRWIIICTTIAGCLSGFTNTFAQDKVHYSFDIGVTVSYFDKQHAPFPDPELVEDFEKTVRPSLEFGGYINYALTNTLSISTGLRYAEKGGAYKVKNPDYQYVNQSSGSRDAYNFLRYRLVYVEIPVTLKANVFDILGIDSEQSRLDLCGGVIGMLNIGSKLRYNVFEGTSDVKESWEAEKLKGANSFIPGWMAGVEWTGGPLIIYGRYSKNIGKVYDTDEPGYEDFNVDMSTVSLGLGFIIN